MIFWHPQGSDPVGDRLHTREPLVLVHGLPRQHGPNGEAFGPVGAGGPVAFANPVARVGCAFVRNHLENQDVPLMGAALVEALYRCLESATTG